MRTHTATRVSESTWKALRPISYGCVTKSGALSQSSVGGLILRSREFPRAERSGSNMTKHQRVAKSVAIAMIMAMIAVACGGGSGDTAAGEAGAPNFDGAADTGGSPAAISTTAPVPLPEAAPETAPAETEAIAETSTSGLPDEEEEDPWLVSVLHVNDDVQIVPTFDAPNGNQTTLFDINAIDGVEWEYPLLAETHFKNRLALLVDEFDSTGAWAKVFIPVRPNGTTAWIQTAFFTVEEHNYHITIDISDNTVQVWQGETALFIDEQGESTPQIAVSGKPSRPTPIVRSYIDEKIPGGTLSPAYGDWVLSIAAFSESLGTFGGGGMPKLALHGTNQPELMGQYVSSGCVRIPNDVVSFIAETVPVGTVVDIIP